MSKLYSNPFVWGNPVSGNRYVSRATEEEQIRDCLEKDQQVILTGPRGAGKTSLVQKASRDQPGENLYLDLSFVVDGASLVYLLAKTIRQVVPALKEDPRLNAHPDVGLDISLEEIFHILRSYLKEAEQKIIIIWDEFQHIVKLKEDVLTELKRVMNGQGSIMNVIVSHREDLMEQAFLKKGERGLPRKCHLKIDTIDLVGFRSFLTRFFRRMGLNDFDLPDALLKFTGGQAYLTQRFAAAVASCWLEGTTTRLKDRALKKLLNEMDAEFSSRWDQFGVNEKRLLLGLAHGYSRPTELSFIDRFGLSATSTAHNTVLKLLREGWLTNRDEGYYVYDPLFLTWLKKRNDIS